MTVAYADAAALVEWTDKPAPADAERLLARASELLDDIVVAAFAVDAETSLPADARVAAALSKACCAQVELWLRVDEENDIDGLAGSAFMLTGSSGYQGKRSPTVAPRATRILRAAGLL